MIRRIVGLGAIALTLLVVAPRGAAAGSFAALFAFGDSLMDAGNVAILADAGLLPGVPPGSRQPLPLADAGSIPGLPYAGSDNFSNGPTWVTLLAEANGLPAPPSNALIDPATRLFEPEILGGANFAFGGARSGPPGDLPPSLLDQVELYSGAVSLYGRPAPDSLFVVGIGGNNVRDALNDLLATGGFSVDHVGLFASDVEMSLIDLINNGARDILLSTVPDVGLAPAVSLAGAGPAATEISRAFNDALEDTVEEVRDFAQGLDVAISIFDAFALGQQIAADPASFGFEVVDAGCAADPACIADAAVADTYAFWDGIHPTAALHV